MAVGRPVLYLGPLGSHGGELVTHAQCGWVVAHGDVAAAVTAIEAARRMTNEDRAAMGSRGAELIRCDYAKDAAVGRICEILEGNDE
jgi:glycosyltransferase involved in cell wall biosynthesis